MQNKKGLSQVVTTILFVIIGLVAIAIIWVAVDATILSKAERINLGSLTLDLEILSAKVNLSNPDNPFATVKVGRNQGEGDLESIKFIVEDEENSQVYEHILEDEFLEYEKRTISFSLADSYLDLNNIKKISIVPVYYTSSGSLETQGGQVADSIEGDLSQGEGDEGDDDGGDEGDDDFGWTGISCATQEDCDIYNEWVMGAEKTCDGIYLMQDQWVYTCEINIGECSRQIENSINEICDSDCALDPQGDDYCDTNSCTIETMETDCGPDEPQGKPYCVGAMDVYQDYTNWSCTSELCNSTINSYLKETCEEGDICFQGSEGGECVLYQECIDTQDCIENETYGLGYVCEESWCVPETPTSYGYINTSWPYTIGEYFDSQDLPYDSEAEIKTNFIIFGGETSEDRCLQVSDFNYFEGGMPYVRLNVTQSNISAGDYFETWETIYGCEKPYW